LLGFLMSISVFIEIAASGLFSSWDRPAISVPTAAIFSRNARPSSTPTSTRQPRPPGSRRPFQKARAVAAQRNIPGMSVSRRCAWP